MDSGDADAPQEQSLAQLVRQLSDQSTRLAHQELELARAELEQKVRRATIGAGMFGGAGLLGFYAGGGLIATVILALATAVAPWLAALIVTAALGGAAGAAALLGRHQVALAVPPLPEQAIDSVREDAHAVTTSIEAGRQ